MTSPSDLTGWESVGNELGARVGLERDALWLSPVYCQRLLDLSNEAGGDEDAICGRVQSCLLIGLERLVAARIPDKAN